ncbi:similar to Saccharomyces cerevisiae YDR378C LSM6 Lsm (Like Sm) protein [Geotrichum candidum]|uniref:Similar to Saccharomyces cerevisiae YDR378C LSM6 Lsm (Like Sm) protein n=1 Tax=Geotrichum candidum TaxID=1173061 RepID=A0A0J9X3X0_GEOCN|nr:similar to Saccharomyces cerevisiae YDR378C LSM6 Lsm (Like Sm) protein [Geotrichum candidum]
MSEPEKSPSRDESAQEVATETSQNDPSSFLSEIRGSDVIVKLNSGVEYHGKLQSVDGFMNIALESTREFFNNKQVNSYGDVFIRGNNVIFISAA